MMAFCTNCGSSNADGATFCTNCGSAMASQQAAPQQQTVPQYEAPQQTAPQYQEQSYPYTTPEYTYSAVQPSAPRKLATGQLVFSIINIVLGCCLRGGFVFGIIALIMTLVAKGAGTDEDAAKKLRIAKILNIIGLVASLLIVVLFIALFFMGALSEFMYESGNLVGESFTAGNYYGYY